jgi:hypothetical protein
MTAGALSGFLLGSFLAGVYLGMEVEKRQPQPRPETKEESYLRRLRLRREDGAGV